ncbi:hypothetical protein JW968_04060 [Candidatus Woesearchaeota archaeon]|nr:hypothetical protein [Candidatus Woesearchaeota archaeon]
MVGEYKYPKKGMFTGFLLFSVIFMLGWSSSALYQNLSGLTISEPSNLVKGDINSLFKAKERISPSDKITEDKIHVYNDRVIIYMDNPVWAGFTDTNSMDPVFDAESNAIEIVPKSPDQIHVGDIISYESKYAEGTIIHRVVEKGADDEGVYFIMKGDNNPDNDPGKVRFSQVKRLLVAIIY